jgi:putative ATPase
VPTHLRDAHYQGAARLGHGQGYQYPHSDERGWVEQAYRPGHLEGRVYYEPSVHGAEPRRLAAWLGHRTSASTEDAGRPVEDSSRPDGGAGRPSGGATVTEPNPDGPEH